MTRADYFEIVSTNFYAFLWDYDETANRRYKFNLFQDYVAAWIEEGEAIEYVGGDHAALLGGVVVALTEYIEDPSRLDYRDSEPPRKRRVRGFLDLESGAADFLRPESWRSWIFKKLCERGVDNY